VFLTTVSFLLQTAANDDDDDDDDEETMKLSSSMSKKTVITTKMVQRWSNALSVSSVTLSSFKHFSSIEADELYIHSITSVFHAEVW